MSTLRKTARYVSKITPEEYLLISSIERLSRKYKQIPLKELMKVTGLSSSYIISLIERLTKHGFIIYTEQPYESVIILTSGIDLLALKKLTDREILAGIGRKIGVGKEADVYEAIDSNSNPISLKIYRLGRTSFRGIHRHRKYVNIRSPYKWVLRNYISAKREYVNLVMLYQRGVSVPRPIYSLMHILVMEYLDGFLLNDLKGYRDPYNLFINIIREIKKTWDTGFVNGDLSEYNIFLLRETLKPILIDWPQAYKREERKSVEYLKKDIRNLMSFFIKKYNCKETHLLDIIRNISLRIILE